MNLEPDNKNIDDELEYEPNEETYQAIDDAENDRNMLGPFDSTDELFEDLDE